MERHRGRGLFEALADLSRGHAFGAPLDQQAKDVEARFLSQGAEFRDDD